MQTIFNPTDWTSGQNDIKGLFGSGQEPLNGDSIANQIRALQKRKVLNAFPAQGAKQDPIQYLRDKARALASIDPEMSQQLTDKANEMEGRAQTALQKKQADAESNDMNSLPNLKEMDLNYRNALMQMGSENWTNMNSEAKALVLETIKGIRSRMSATPQGRALMGIAEQETDVIPERNDVPKVEEGKKDFNAFKFDLKTKATDADSDGVVDNLDDLEDSINNFTRGLGETDPDVMNLKKYWAAIKDRIALEKDADYKKQNQQRDATGDAQTYANRVYDQVNKNNASELDGIRSIGKILTQVSTGSSSMNNYNAVKAALRAAVPEAVNEGDITNIKNLQNGSFIATLLQKIGASQAITDSDVKSAIDGLVQLYNSSYAKISANIEAAKRSNSQYKNEVAKALDGILQGYPKTQSGIIGSQKPVQQVAPQATKTKSGFTVKKRVQ